MFFRMWVGILALALCVPGAFAQSSQGLSKKEAAKLLKQSKQELSAAKKAAAEQKAEEATAHAGQYTATMNRLSHGLGRVEGKDAIEVAAKVDEATLKHTETLQEVLDKVPQQARPAIQRAMEASRNGHDAATAALLDHAAVTLPRGLDDRSARDAMEKNNQLLEHAQRAQERGDSKAVSQAVERYNQNMDRVNQALARGAVDSSDQASVLSRVDSATRRQTSVLQNLLGKVPQQARQGIEKALVMSQRGNAAATSALANTPAAGRNTGRPGTAGPPSGMGQPAGVGGPPSGIGGPSGVGGPPAGVPHGGPPH